MKKLSKKLNYLEEELDLNIEVNIDFTKRHLVDQYASDFRRCRLKKNIRQS